MLKPKKKSSKGMLPIRKLRKKAGLYITMPDPVRHPLTNTLKTRIMHMASQNKGLLSICTPSRVSNITVINKETTDKIVYSFNASSF